jgi:hypothetical protein
MTQEDIKKEIIREFRATKLNKLCYMGSGGDEHKDDLCNFISQALDTAFKEWAGAVRMEKKKIHIEIADTLHRNVGYNQAVQELNKKLQELGE